MATAAGEVVVEEAGQDLHPPEAPNPPVIGARPKTSLSSVKLERFNGSTRSVETYRSWKKTIEAH
eukprot:866095-Amphidinium_carterae.1